MYPKKGIFVFLLCTIIYVITAKIIIQGGFEVLFDAISVELFIILVYIISPIYMIRYYLAMKMVPLLERKVLYLSFVENIKLNDICRRLKLSKNEVIKLRNKGINHFKHNLSILYKSEKLKRGTKNEKKS